MNLVYIGKLVNTHGIKGEVRIISDFKYKEEVFKKDNYIYIDNNKYKINSYRKHKEYDMVILDTINSIDDALKLKGNNVYVDRNDYTFEGFLNEDLIGLDVYDKDTYKGKVKEILKGVKYDLLVVEGAKRHLIPNIDKFVKKVDLKNKKIEIEYILGLDNED